MSSVSKTHVEPMNNLQKIILSLYAPVIVVMCLIPPYQRNLGTSMRDTGYMFIWESTNYTRGTVNIQLLGIQMLVATLVAAALWLVAKDGNSFAVRSATKGVNAQRTKRTALAFVVCFTLFFVYILAKGIVRAAGFGLGAIPDAILCLILFAVWRAIRGASSDSATEQTGNSPAPLLVTTEPAELSAFELLAREKETGFRHEALWLKCFTEAEGDQARAEAAYNRERAATLAAQANEKRIAEHRAKEKEAAQEVAEKRAALAKDIARLMAWRAEISRHMAKLERLFDAVPPRKAAEAVHVQVGNRVEMEAVKKTLPQALAEFQTAAKKLHSEIQVSEWEGGHLKQPLAAAVKGDTSASLTWFECLALVNQSETWNQLNMRVQDAIHRLEDWLLLHDAHAQTLTDADAAISEKQSAKIISALHDKLRGVRFADLNYKNLEGFIVAREGRSATLLLSISCLIIVGWIGFGIYSAQTSMPLRGSQSELSANASIVEIRSRAELGEKEAQFRLGEAYITGEGVLKDDVKAVEWLRKAAEQGHAESQSALGVCYHKGEGIPKDDVEAVKWYRAAADQGYAEAQYNLGFHYGKGEGVPKDDVEAVKWYRKAAAQGDAWAAFALGVRYGKGEGVLKDDVEAVKWYRKAAEQGDAVPQNILATCYRDGLGVSKDSSEAAKWFRKAAEQGLAEAQSSLGFCYYKGEGVPKDDVEAVKWYRKAADQGHAKAQSNLGVCYHKGEGVLKDDVEAVKWYRKAAEQEYAWAQNNLGLCYHKGEGVPKDDVEAVKWYRKAAEQGHAWAQNNLGVRYQEGKGAPQDDVEAAKWYILAAAQQNKDSDKSLTGIVKEMTREQVAEAHRRADEFKRQHVDVSNQ